MNIIHIAWRNFWQRSLSSVLTTISLALGVGLVVLVLAVYGIVSDAFRRNASVGYNLVIGAKGSRLQLTLNSVYYLSEPIENLPYTEYMEFLPKDQRAALVQECSGEKELAEKMGKYAPYIHPSGFVIPLALGDYFGRFRVVGTTPQFFEKLRPDPDSEEPLPFAQGRPLVQWSAKHEYFEAVVGARVADEMNVQIGDEIFPTHGDPSGHGHDQGFTIVGILDWTATPNDRAAFVNLEGFYLMEGHAKPIEESEATGSESLEAEEMGDNASQVDEKTVSRKYKPLPIAQREVTALLVRTSQPFFGPQIQNVVNEGFVAQAAAPIRQINMLMELIVVPLRTALIAITVITCIVAAVGILVSIYNSMNDRRREIAIMRALGARRDTVTVVILMESLLIAVIGGIVGWFLAHIAIQCASGYIEKQTGIQVSMFTVSPYEIMVLPLALGLATLAGLLPAFIAYRTDVSTHLNA